MESLYGRLFRYRERPHRSPKEDFLTEALADLLNRMPREVMAEFAGSLFLSEEARSEWRKLVTEIRRFRWSTHYSISVEDRVRLPDLALLCDENEHPLLFIENKIGHRISEYANRMDENAPEPETDKAETETTTQLTAYGNWLARRSNGHDWPGAVTLLTHFTPPPADFAHGDTARYSVRFQRVCRWHELHRRLINYLPGQVGEEWRLLAYELGKFLGEEDMDSDTVTFNDIAKAEIFIQSGKRFEKTFHRIWEELADVWNERRARNRPSRAVIEYESEYAILWDYIYLKPPYAPETVRDWYIAWGIRFPELTNEWKDADPSLPSRPHAFVCFGAESGQLPGREVLEEHGLPSGWVILPDDAERVVVGRPVSDFSDNPTSLVQELSSWIKSKAGELDPFIRSLANTK